MEVLALKWLPLFHCLRHGWFNAHFSISTLETLERVRRGSLYSHNERVQSVSSPPSFSWFLS